MVEEVRLKRGDATMDDYKTLNNYGGVKDGTILQFVRVQTSKMDQVKQGINYEKLTDQQYIQDARPRKLKKKPLNPEVEERIRLDETQVDFDESVVIENERFD